MRKVTKNSGPSSRSPDVKMKPSLKRSARTSKKFSRRSNLSAGSRISNDEDAPGRHGNGDRADPAKEVPAAEDPTAEDPAEVSATEGLAEVLMTGTVVTGITAKEAAIRVNPNLKNLTRLPTNNIPLRDKRSAYAVFRGSGVLNLPRKIENI